MIVASSIIEDRAQADGRRDVTERHVFDDGFVRFVNYLAAAKANVIAAMAARVAFLEDQRAAEDIETRSAALMVSTRGKIDSYIGAFSVSDLQAKVLLTPEEIAALPAVLNG